MGFEWAILDASVVYGSLRTVVNTGSSLVYLKPQRTFATRFQSTNRSIRHPLLSMCNHFRRSTGAKQWAQQQPAVGLLGPFGQVAPLERPELVEQLVPVEQPGWVALRML